MSTRKPPNEQARQDKLNRLLEQFLSKDDGDDGEAQGRAIEQFVLEFVRLQQGADESPLNKRTRIDAATAAKAATWDTDVPKLVAAQKILNRAFTGRYAEAAMYAERNHQNETKKVVATKSAYGRDNAKKKHATKSQAKEQGVADYLANREKYSKLKKVVAAELAGKFPPVSVETFKKAIRNL